MNERPSNAPNFTHFLVTHRPTAEAVMEGSPAYPAVKGRVLLYPLNDRYTIVVARFEGLPVEETCAPRFFALHIHNGDACTGDAGDPFRNAGMHYDPADCPHPAHAGDLPPMLGTAAGQAWSATLTDRFSAREVVGKAVILHRRPDDFHTQPAGNAGEKMACGIIRPLYR